MNGFWDFFWFLVASFLFLAYLMVLFQILTDVFRDRSVSGGAKAIWVVCLIFFPVLTAIVYLVVRGDGMAQRSMESTQAAQANADSYIRSVAGPGSSPAEEIARAKALLDSGTISQAEYEALKTKALS